jgi:cell division protein FtsZ
LFAIAGDQTMTMFEVQEAAKVIIEAIDPNAKVIFGAFHDEKLNKNEIKVTVIASGFPEGMRRKPAAAPGAPESRSFLDSLRPSRDEAEPVAEKTSKKAEPAPAPATKTAPTKTTETDDDDDWSSIPAFLRRPKSK